MTNEELLMLIKYKYSLEGKRWQMFCKRYAFRDMSTIIYVAKEICTELDTTLTNNFLKFLRRELKNEILNMQE